VAAVATVAVRTAPVAGVRLTIVCEPRISLRVELRPGETTTVGPFRFDAGVDLAGGVVDASGRAVSGAHVTPFENDERTTVTQSDGRFVLRHLSPGTAELCVTADGFPETRLVAATGEPLVVVLRPGGVVRGTATSRGGDRVEQRRLCIFDAAAQNGFVPHWHATVDKAPKFSIRLPAGRYRFVPIRYKFHADAVCFEVAEGGETVVNLVLPW
jgi:hypothetical protein